MCGSERTAVLRRVELVDIYTRIGFRLESRLWGRLAIEKVMKASFCSPRSVVYPSDLPDIRYELGPYYGCEHQCRYCYVLNNAETDWSKEVLVHEDFPGQLEEELSALAPGTVLIGRDTDPYQPVEETLRHTRTALELLSKHAFPVCILTKSDRVVRDLDLLSIMPGSSVGFSLSFHSEQIRSLFERSASPNESRLDALKKAREGRIETYVLISPIFPFLTDVDALIRMTAPVADTIWFYRLTMGSDSDPSWIGTATVLQEHFPHLLNRFKDVAFSTSHPYWSRLRQMVQSRPVGDGPVLRIEF